MCLNQNDLLRKLVIVIYKYIEDEEVAKELIKYIDPKKIKYVLAGLDNHKKRSYSNEDIELIKDIYFYFC